MSGGKFREIFYSLGDSSAEIVTIARIKIRVANEPSLISGTESGVVRHPSNVVLIAVCVPL